MATTDSNQAVSKGNFITSAHLHFMPLNHGYCSLKRYGLPACILTIPSLSAVRVSGIYGSLAPDAGGSIKQLCVCYTCAFVACDLIQRAMLMPVTDPSG